MLKPVKCIACGKRMLVGMSRKNKLYLCSRKQCVIDRGDT